MNNTYPFVNTPLPYAYDALEPYIDAETMELHHDKHLQGYIDNLNKTLKPYPSLHSVPLDLMLARADRLPSGIRVPIMRYGGGVYNHRFFFDGLTPDARQRPKGTLLQAIDRDFGSYENMLKQYKEAAQSVFGSGYAWLVTTTDGTLRFVTTVNQDSMVPRYLCPISNIDVWEHAYYLKHQNRRAEYIDDIFDIINWDEVNRRYVNCLIRHGYERYIASNA